jgi:transcriptional regulator with XRE-family HTH domain
MPRLGPHSVNKSQTPKRIGERLRLIRLAYGRMIGMQKELSQSELSRMIGVGVSSWNNSETGDARIGIDSASKLRRVTGASLDYIYEDDATKLPHDLRREIDALVEEMTRDLA